MPPVPFYLDLIFAILAVLSVKWIYYASRNNKILIISLLWLLLQSVLAGMGVYQNTSGTPPNVFFGVLPVIISIVIYTLSRKGKEDMRTWNLKSLTYLHTIRIPVEIGLFFLYSFGAISILQTFEGWNYDVLSGITAPLIGYFAFKKNVVNKKLLLAWNVVCLILLLTIVVISILALPVSFQKLAFDQPNLAILFLPFNLLASVIVPCVFLAHMAAFVQLSGSNS
mgnify:CR=1 FL=1